METTLKNTSKSFNPLFSVLLSLVVYMALLPYPAASDMSNMLEPHFYAVSIIAGIAALIAIAMGISGTRLRNQQVVFMALSFLSLTMLFGLHGLSTPGILLKKNRIVGVSAQLSFTVMSLWLFISTLPSDNRLVKFLFRFGSYLIPGMTLLLGLFASISLIYPEIGETMPVDRAPVKWFFGTLTILLTMTASFRFWKSYRYSRFPLQIALAHTAGLMAIAQIILSTSDPWSSSWWWYHGILLLIVILPVIGLLKQYQQGDSLVSSAKGIFSIDPAERLEAGISPSVRTLVERAEMMDEYMAGHSRRVALAALRLGSALKISPEQLRALAQGAILHDIGKLDVSGDLLNIPGELTSEQRVEIEKHTENGYEMCKQLGFMDEELNIIHYHHERIDGSGYPEGRKGDEIPTLARVLAVVDVYDALTSDRAYRSAWTQEEAIKHLLENRGTMFDTSCVNTWVKLIIDDKQSN